MSVMFAKPTYGKATIALVATLAATWLARASDDETMRFAPLRWTPSTLSTDLYESSPTFSRDGRELYFFRADKRFGNYRLLQSRCIDGRWSTPKAPAFAASAGTMEADPALAPDGRRLYYVSAREAANADDLDIWYVERSGDDAPWSRPRRLPAPVNSPSAELLPRPLGAGRLLFGSSRPGGHGQGDIYIATPQSDGRWRVDNVGPPISTAANEYEAELSRDGRVMVVVADRGDRSHLYVYDRRDGTWVERGRVPARTDVFQVGPLLSPDAGRLLFAQADGERSGEWFVVDLRAGADTRWPPACGR
jgi:Tol biopolymer transport system component